MGIMVAAGASYQCSFGTTPGTLNVTSQNTLLVEGKPAATVKDMNPNVNIAPCGMCSSLANPQVAAATAAALGVLTPQPCIPALAGPWIPAQSKCISGKAPCLTSDSRLMCSYGGMIQIVNPGATKVMI